MLGEGGIDADVDCPGVAPSTPEMDFEIIDLTVSDSEDGADDDIRSMETVLACSPVMDQEPGGEADVSDEEKHPAITLPVRKEERGQLDQDPDTASRSPSSSSASSAADPLRGAAMVTQEETAAATKSPPRRDISPDLAEAGQGVSGDFPDSFDTLFTDKGTVKVSSIDRDGHCMFRSCLHQLMSLRQGRPSDEAVTELRRKVADYMRNHREELSPFFVENDGQTLNDSINDVEAGEWGDASVLSCIARLWSRTIEVHYEMGPVIVIPPQSEHSSDPCVHDQTEEPIRIAFRCVFDGEGRPMYNHYDSVVEVTMDRQITLTTIPVTSTSPTTTTSRAVSPSHPGPACSPRPSASPAGSRRSDRPGGSPSVRKRLCRERSTSFGSAVSHPNLEMSPMLALSAPPGSPDIGESSPYDEAPQSLNPAYGDDRTPPATQEAILASQEAIFASQEETLVPPSSESSMERLTTQAFSPPRRQKGLDQNDRVFEWICNITPNVEQDQPAEELIVHVEEEPAVDKVAQVLQVRDAQTYMHSISDVTTHFYCRQTAPRTVPTCASHRSTRTKSSRTVCTNVSASHGKLVGTFQSFYPN